MDLADEAMEAAEKASDDGATKKEIAIEAVKAAAASQSIDANDFLDKLSAYIDDTIAFVNKLTKE